jgi:hypothetical protein
MNPVKIYESLTKCQKAVEKFLNYFFKHSCVYVAIIVGLDPDSVKPGSRFGIQHNTLIRIQCIRDTKHCSLVEDVVLY